MARSRKLPFARIGPVTLPLNPAAGANLPTVTSERGCACKLTFMTGVSPNLTAPLPGNVNTLTAIEVRQVNHSCGELRVGRTVQHCRAG